MSESRSPVGFQVRRARTADVTRIQALVDPLVQEGILLGKELVDLYADVQEFRVAETDDGRIVGCGALHVFWQDLGEVRTLAVSPQWRTNGVGSAMLRSLESEALELGLSRLFCLTFEKSFFAAQGYQEVGEGVVPPEVYSELVRSHDDGVAEFLDLARVKPNTLGNSRMLKSLVWSPR